VQTSPAGGQVEYALARNAVVREYRRGRLSRLDVCDAHPELVRCARNLGDATGENCPICEDAVLVDVTFVFGARLPSGGRCVATKAELEDLYLPFKPKRRSKATIAREAGLGPLASALLADPSQAPPARAEKFVDEAKGIRTPEEALEGARAILVEQFSEKAELIGFLRESFWSRGRIVSKVRDGKAQEGAKFSDYFDFFEPLAKLPSHRILALFRGEKEEILDLALEPESAAQAEIEGEAAYERAIAASFGVMDRGRPGDKWLADCVRWAWRTRIKISLSVDLRARLWQNAEDQGVKVFAGNLRDLLLAAPAGPRATMGLDPGFRTGVKVAVVDATGKVVDTTVIYPHEPQRRWDEALMALGRLIYLLMPY